MVNELMTRSLPTPLTIWVGATRAFRVRGSHTWRWQKVSGAPSTFGVMAFTAQYRASQPSFDDLGTPLHEVTFCVVDLETTGGTHSDAITEIGAVKVHGGEIIGEFQTLVRPDEPIPAFISVLTGITNAMVADAPRMATVLPSFLEFSRGSVLVAHNAGFDIGFLKRACITYEHPWPNNPVIDTVSLARHAMVKEEVPNCKLATLAAYFNASVTPDHRALSDARATVDVLHGLLERLGNRGVSTLQDLEEYTRQVSPQRRAKREWAISLPHAPGVYWFYADFPSTASAPARREVLYVGKSVDLKRRVRGYFTASETRGRMEEMVRVSSGVDYVECSTALESEVRELRLIASHAPRYNRRSRRQDKVMWLKLTVETFPRLSIVNTIAEDDATYLGPFTKKQSAEDARHALFDAHRIRQCTKRLSAKTASPACMLGQMGRCVAPCELGDRSHGYADIVDDVRQALATDVHPTVERVSVRLRSLVEQQRFEEAADVRSRLQAYVTAIRRWHRLTSISRCRQIVAARWLGDKWEIHVIRYGKLAAAAVAPIGTSPRQVADQAVAAAETVLAPPGGAPAGSVEEAERIACWMELEGVRLLDIDGEWSWPIGLGDGNLATLVNIPASLHQPRGSDDD